MTLRYLRHEVTVPVIPSSRETVLRQENVEEVLEGSGFSIRLGQNGRTQVSLCDGTLVPDDDYRLADRCITTDQRGSLAAGTRDLVRTLPQAWCKSSVDGVIMFDTHLDPTLGAVQASRPFQPFVVWTNRTDSHLNTYIWVKVKLS